MRLFDKPMRESLVLETFYRAVSDRDIKGDYAFIQIEMCNTGAISKQ
jgi:hypothetical protein